MRPGLWQSNVSKKSKRNGKQWRAWSDSSSRSSLIWVSTVCLDLSVRKLRIITVSSCWCLKDFRLIYSLSHLMLKIYHVFRIVMLLGTQTLEVSEPHHYKACLRGYATRLDTNWSAQLQKLARVEILDSASTGNLLSRQWKNKGADLLLCCLYLTLTGFLMPWLKHYHEFPQNLTCP